jgi:hypothetical protein
MIFKNIIRIYEKLSKLKVREVVLKLAVEKLLTRNKVCTMWIPMVRR